MVGRGWQCLQIIGNGDHAAEAFARYTARLLRKLLLARLGGFTFPRFVNSAAKDCSCILLGRVVFLKEKVVVLRRRRFCGADRLYVNRDSTPNFFCGRAEVLAFSGRISVESMHTFLRPDYILTCFRNGWTTLRVTGGFCLT